MPRGGFRIGAGGPKGPRGPQKKTIERAIIAEQIVRRAEMTGEKLAKEILNDFMQLFAGMAASVQPLPPGVKKVPKDRGTPNVRAFEKWARLAVETAAALAKYQSPQLRAIAVSTPGAAQAGNDAKLIEGNVVVLDNDPIGASRVYHQIVAASGKRG